MVGNAKVDELLRFAVTERRLVAFILDRSPRVAEPQPYGGPQFT